MLPPPAPISIRSTAGAFRSRPLPFLETAHARHLELRRARRLAARDQRDLGGRAAHVEGQDVGRAETLGKVCGDRDASGGPGFDQPHRELAREIQAQRSAAGAHHEEGATRSAFLQGLGQLGQVARHQRLDIGVGHGGGNATVLADLGQDARGQRHREIGSLRQDGACRNLLVGRIGVGVQEAHGDRLDVIDLQRAQGITNLARDELRQHTPIEANALVDADAPTARHQRRRELDEQIVQVVAKLGTGLKHIAKPARGEQRGARTLALDDRVGGERRAMHDRANRIVFGFGLLENLRDCRQHRLRRLLRRGQHLG